MAIPSQKSPAMESAINKIFGTNRAATIRADKCVSCGGDATEFRDEISRREYGISGLCSDCQDAAFGYEDFD